MSVSTQKVAQIFWNVLDHFKLCLFWTKNSLIYFLVNNWTNLGYFQFQHLVTLACDQFLEKFYQLTKPVLIRRWSLNGDLGKFWCKKIIRFDWFYLLSLPIPDCDNKTWWERRSNGKRSMIVNYESRVVNCDGITSDFT